MDPTTTTEAVGEKVKQHLVDPGEAAVDAIAGAAAGAAMGSIAGPPGAIAGAVIGGAAGVAVAAALHAAHIEEARRDEALDRDMGVIGGSLGEARPDAPRSERGCFHAASLGVGGAGEAQPAEGMIQSLDEE